MYRSTTHSNVVLGADIATSSVQNAFNEGALKPVAIVGVGGPIAAELCTNWRECELPDLQHLSMRDDANEQNSGDAQHKEFKYQSAVPQPLGKNMSPYFDGKECIFDGKESIFNAKEQNSDTQHKELKCQSVVPQPREEENVNLHFDDGIPKLPDLSWVSDQGDVDPLCRLYKAESAASDASKQDLMSDLLSGDDG